MKKQNSINIFFFSLVVGLLVACDSAEESKEKYIQQGKALLIEGRDVKALLAFKNALQIDPKDVEGHYQLAEAYSKQGEFKKAYGHYRNVMALDEGHVMSRVRTGVLFLLGRNLDVAEQLKEEAVALAPDNVEVLIFQARLEAVKKNEDVAIATIKRAIQLEADNIPAIVLLASLRAQTGEFDNAIKLLKDVEANNPDSKSTELESIHLLLAKIYLKKQSKADVENELKTLIKINPRSIAHYKRLAVFYLEEKQENEAGKILRSAVSQLPDDESAQALLVEFLVKYQGLDKAIDELAGLITLKPDTYSLRFKLFAMQLKNEKAVVAEETLNTIIELDGLGSAGLKARNMLARYFVTINRVDQAIELMNFVLAENPRDAEALSLRGQIALNENRVLDAISDFRAVLVGQPDNINILKLLSSAQEANNDDVLAIENLRKVSVLAPEDIDSKQKLIELLFRSKKMLQAEQHIDALLKVDPKNEKALDSLFKLRVSSKEWDKAQQIALVYQNDLKDKSKAKGFYMSGVAYQAEGKLDKSIGAFKQALTLKQDVIQPLTQLIKSYVLQKQFDKAIAYLKDIIKIENDHFFAKNLLGELYVHEKKEELAEKAFRQSISIKPEWFNSYHNLALLFSSQKKTDAAKDVLRNGLEKTNGSLILIGDLAVIYQSEGNYDEVIKLYEDAYVKAPDSVLVVNNLASYIAEYQATGESLARATKMVALLEKSTNPNMLDTAAWVWYKQGHYAKAQALLEKAVEKGSVSPELNYHLGMVYYKQGKTEPAQIQLQKSLMPKVEFTNVEQARKILKEIKGG